MIGAFHWRDDKLMSEIGEVERRLFIRIFRDVRDLIVQPLTRTNFPPGVDERPGESDRDLEILQALDFEPDLDWGTVPGRADAATHPSYGNPLAGEHPFAPSPPTDGEDVDFNPVDNADFTDPDTSATPLLADRQEDIPPLDPPDDPALQHLLPPLSSDPEEAARMRAIIEPGLRAEKGGKLSDVIGELLHPSGPGHRVVAKNPVAWLQAMNDVRVVIATRIGIYRSDDPLSFVDVQYDKKAGEEDKLLSTVYEVLSWWQDSLVSALGSAEEAG